MARMGTETSPYAQTEQRIAWLTLAIGFVAAAAAASLREWRWAAGLGIGAGLAWLNFRWLKKGLDALMRVSVAQAEKEKVRVPFWTMVRLLGRYALIGLLVYVIFLALKVPIASMLVGLCALGAATLLASLYETLRPGQAG